MIRLGWGTVFGALVVAGCNLEVGLPEDEEEDRARNEIVDRLQGSWATQCLFAVDEDTDEDRWLQQTYEFAIHDELVAEDAQTVREIDFTFDGIDLSEGEAEVPDTPFRRFDILYLREDDSGYLLGETGQDHRGDSADSRPLAVDFSVEYKKR